MLALLALAVAMLLTVGPARADAPLSQGFEDGAPAWSATGMWHVQDHPEAIAVSPAIAGVLTTFADDGHLPAAVQGSQAAWFGEPATGTYCGADFASLKQTPRDGCTSTQVERGALTSPPFSLAGRDAAFMVFRAWWEIEAVNADVADQMRVEYSVDGGATWHLTGLLNPLDPSWGGRHQPYGDDGARTSSTWQSYGVDLSAAAGQPDVRVRFVFDTLDNLRNGYRGLLVDGVAIVDPLGATITEPAAGPFTDSPPSISVTGSTLSQDPGGDWKLGFHVLTSAPAAHPVGVDWTVRGHTGDPVATGHATVSAGQTDVPVSVPVSGLDTPYTVTLTNPTGGAIAPGAGVSSTPGGGIPAASVTSLAASPQPDGNVAVAITISLSVPAPTDTSVDYTLTGSDGVVAATGTMTIPGGATSVSATVDVPADHAPYTVGLSNPRGIVLNPSASVATTSPLAGVSNASIDQATLDSQLVLGAREANIPTLYKTFFLTALSGTVRYHTPDGSYKQLPNGTIELPFGSVVDATDGHALITVESDSSGGVQQVEIWAGKAGVFQVGNPAVTELRLAGGDFSVCAGSSRTKRVRTSGAKVIRQLWASAKGRFRTKGRYGAATVRGTKWSTEDLCLATRFTVVEGIVSVFDFRRKTTTALRAGQTQTITPLGSARFKKRRGVHKPRLSRQTP